MKNRLLFKTVSLLIVLAMLMLGLSMIQDVVKDRIRNRDYAVQSVVSSLAGSQTLIGPALVQNCTETTSTPNGKKIEYTTREFQRQLLPDSVSHNANAAMEERSRGLHLINAYVLHDQIQAVSIPLETVTEITESGMSKTYDRKVYPGYVLVHMIETSESWYLVRNTRGVTGFVGPDSKPVALTPAEVDMMLSTQQNSVEFGIAIGEEVRILSGPLENFTGVVEDVDTVRQKLTVKVKMFLGREMPVEVDLQDVEKVQPK